MQQYISVDNNGARVLYKLYWQFIQGTFSNKIQITHLYFSILLFYCFTARKCGFLFNVYQGRKRKCMSTGLKCTFFCQRMLFLFAFFSFYFFSITSISCKQNFFVKLKVKSYRRCVIIYVHLQIKVKQVKKIYRAKYIYKAPS